ncbi:MAG: hypothetical protein KGJ06_06970 [Pseudomonadota bacterium]|nr:hypothetical protein [Pseudomonadota bacterium]
MNPQIFRKEPRPLEVIHAELFCASTQGDRLETGDTLSADIITDIHREAINAADAPRLMMRQDYGVDESPAALAKKIDDFGELLQKIKEKSEKIEQCGISIALGLEQVMLPILHWAKEIQKDADNAREAHDDDQRIAFIRHIMRLMLELCDHPDVKAPVRNSIRKIIIGDLPGFPTLG